MAQSWQELKDKFLKVKYLPDFAIWGWNYRAETELSKYNTYRKDFNYLIMSYRCLWEVMVTERWVVYAHWSFWWMCSAVTDLKGMAGRSALVFAGIHRFYRHQKQQYTGDTTAASSHVWKYLWWCNCYVIWVTWTKSLCYKLELRSHGKHVILERAAVYHMILHHVCWGDKQACWKSFCAGGQKSVDPRHSIM